MKKLSVFGVIVILFTMHTSTLLAQNLDDKFKNFENSFVDSLWKLSPEWATSVGYHKYDNILTIPNEVNRKNTFVFVQNFNKKLGQYDIKQLSPALQIDYYLIQNQLKRMIWSIHDEKSYEWDPSQYNPSGLLSFMLSEQYAPLEERLQTIVARAESIPLYYQAAMENIKNPVPELQQLAIEQINGGMSAFVSDISDSIKRSKLPEDKKQAMLITIDKAQSVTNMFVDWLTKLHPDHPRSFRLGDPLYSQKFQFDIQSEYTASQLYQFALQRKAYIHTEMAKISIQLWPKYFGKTPQPKDTLVLIRKMIDTLSVHHTTPDKFQSTIEQQIPILEKFIRDHNLLYIDPNKPLVVRKEPAYMAGVAGASISSPGPYDKNGNTYYNVGSLEGWSKDRAESYLREYNDYILQILSIHEAIPGHYTQLVYSNNSPSIIKSILGNGSMIEGWAVYGEQMMLENGYGNNAPEMWLMWYKWNLRTVCNTILDYSVHTQNMTKDQAMSLLVNEAFQQKAEAEGKWRRVSVTSVQLDSYFNGYKEIIQLREDYKKKMGAKYTLKGFNEKFLSYGSAPVKYIRQMMMAD